MPVRLQKAGSDINVWGLTHNDSHKVLLGEGEYIEIENNTPNPPTIKQYSRFFYYNTDNSYTIASGTATGNNVYPQNTTPTYLLADAIYEDGADQTFIWNSGNFPVQSAATFYLYCVGGEDTDATSKGKGTYGASTNAPTYSYEKGGWYSNDGRVLAKFTSSGGPGAAVTLNQVYNDKMHRAASGDIYIRCGTSNKDIIFDINDAGTITEVFRVDGSESSMLFPDNKKTTWGAPDIEIYSDGDDAIIRQLTLDKDIKIYGNDGGVDTLMLTFDASNDSVVLESDLRFSGSGRYLVENNKYAFQSSADPNVGLQFNVSKIAIIGTNATPSDCVELGVSTGAGGSFVKINAPDGTLRHTLNGSGLVTLSCPTDLGSELLILDQNDADKPFIDFQGTAAGTNTATVSTLTTSGATTHHLQIEINGVKAWIAASTNNPT